MCFQNLTLSSAVEEVDLLNGEPATVTLLKFRTANKLKTRNGLISYPGIIKPVKWFKKTDSLEDRPQSGRLSLLRAELLGY